MVSALTMLGGAAIAVASGALNGSWVVPTKANAPKVLRVTDALPWEAFWFIFNISLMLFNGIVTMSIQGRNLFRALSNTSSMHLGLICLCFLGWGVGATGYGLSVKRVGVALGTALVLSAATIVGTILPVIMDFGEAMEQIWFLFAGVLVAVAGFAILGKANLMKDADLAKGPEPAIEPSEEGSVQISTDIREDVSRISPSQLVAVQDRNSNSSSGIKINPVFDTEIELKTVSVPSDAPIQSMGAESVRLSMTSPVATMEAIPPVATTSMHAAHVQSMHENPAAHPQSPASASGAFHDIHEMRHNTSRFTPPCMTCMGAGCALCDSRSVNSLHTQNMPEAPQHGAQPGLSHSVQFNDDVTVLTTPKGGLSQSRNLEEAASATLKANSQFWVNIGIAVLSGVTRALLNVGLVLGKKVETQGQNLGDSEIVSGMAVWFLGFNMCAIPGIMFSAYLLTKNSTWGTMRWHESALTLRRLAVSMGSALTWVVLLHSYGVATFWLGPLGNAVAWPLLLASTILAAQFWSQAVLGEWKGVSTRTKRVNTAALSVLMLSVVITATGVFVDEL